MNGRRLTNALISPIVALALFALILGACGPAAAPTPTPIPAPTAPPTLATLPDGSLVYGDQDGHFSLPLVGDWTQVKTEGSYGHFRLAEPELEMYVVTVESEDLDTVAEEASAQIGLNVSSLSQIAVAPQGRWTVYIYEDSSGQGIGLLAQNLDGWSIALIARGDMRFITTPIPETLLSADGLKLMPLADYLDFHPPPAPSSVQEIKDLNNIEFYSGRNKLVGTLVLPEGEAPFPVVVYVHGSAMSTRTDINRALPTLRAAGLAVFSYDKRGVGQSEGVYLGVSDMSETDPSPSEWTLPIYADDVLAAVTFLRNLREINPKQIGLLGQSQAGSIIPQVAAQSDIPAFAVILIGQTVSVGEVFHYQGLTDSVQRLPPMTEGERDELSTQLATFDGYPGFDPRPYIEAMEIPALWIWGDLDGWVPPRKSRAELERIIAEHDKDFTIIYDPDYGHDWPSSWTSEAVDWIRAQLEE